ncbi:hypothetical protein ACPW7J_04585 [Ihubacter sp. rT4E-8]|uniref:hypothetical protein n=1 Tax=Ihubacter sp. rT4E-8 TaxID=3242369 RepID=UPI003CFB788C
MSNRKVVQANPFITADAQLLKFAWNRVVQIATNQVDLHNFGLNRTAEVVQIKLFADSFAQLGAVFCCKSCADCSFIEGFAQPSSK